MIHIKKHLSFIAALLLSLIVVYCCAVPASADMGPKPSIELHLENPPEGEYYVDILYEGARGYCFLDEKECAERGLNYEMVQVLKNFDLNGQRPRFGGANSGDNTINKPAEVYEFTYDAPSRFRIIVVTEALRTIVSPEIEPYSYNSVITFDIAKMGTDKEKHAVREEMGRTVRKTVKVFLVTLAITLFIEWIVFLCHKISFEPQHNALVFFLVNLLTQIMLYITLIIAYQAEISFFRSMFVIEIVIIIVEVALLRRFLKDVDKTRVGSATVTANIVSALLSLPVWFVIEFAKLLH